MHLRQLFLGEKYNEATTQAGCQRNSNTNPGAGWLPKPPASCRMKTRLTLTLLALAAVSINLHAASSVLPAPLPEFMNQEQLAKWNADQAAAQTTTSTAPESANQFYTGKPYVADAGGYVFKYRTYNPEMSRWTSADPSGFPDGANDKFYAPNPVSSLDQYGLWGWGDGKVQAELNSLASQVPGAAQTALQALADATLAGNSKYLDVEASAGGDYTCGHASADFTIEWYGLVDWNTTTVTGSGTIPTTSISAISATANGNSGIINQTITINSRIPIQLNGSIDATFNPPMVITPYSLRLDSISNSQIALSIFLDVTLTIYSE